VYTQLLAAGYSMHAAFIIKQLLYSYSVQNGTKYLVAT